MTQFPLGNVRHAVSFRLPGTQPRHLVLALLILACLSSCGGGDSDDPDSEADPAEINVASDSAPAAALRAWTLFKDSNWPALAAAYDHEVLDRLGPSDMMDALLVQAGSLQQAPVQKVRDSRTFGGTVVTLNVRYEGERYPVTYLLRKRGGQWRIAYDSLLANGLPTFVTNQIVALTGERPDKPSARTVAAAQQAARIYRSIAGPPGPRRGLLDRLLERNGIQSLPEVSTAPEAP